MSASDMRMKVGLGGGEVLHDGREIVVGHGARLFVGGFFLAPAQRQHADIIASRPGAALGEPGELGERFLERQRAERLTSWRWVIEPHRPSEHSTRTSPRARRVLAMASGRGGM